MAVDQETQETLNQPYAGYYRASHPRRPDMELVETGPDTQGGEYLRRFWHPVCLTADLGELPLAIRIMSEDLVAYRDRSGAIGILHRHCSHRGTSLEYGIVSEHGLRCCYHGWLFDADGSILETPGEPTESRLKESFRHGAYPAVEFNGLVFAYMGPPERKPPFPNFDTFHVPDTELVPYSIWQPCNWLHVHENIVDASHVLFLHSAMGSQQLGPNMAIMPRFEYRETDDGHGCLYVTTRRVGEYVWVRCIHTLLPNIFQAASLYGEIDFERFFQRTSMTRWTVPVDNTNATIFGLRHFNDKTDAPEFSDRSKVGKERIDFAPGQTGGRPYEETQRDPGDWDVLVSLGPIPDHGGEHRGTTEEGVMILRRQLRRGIRQDAEPTCHLPQNNWDARVTFTFDAIMRIPPRESGDNDLLSEVGSRATDIVLQAPESPGPERDAAITERIKALKESFLSDAQ
jgi:nitrite reductase/ring-hydroxylating ferredoxin subunit